VHPCCISYSVSTRSLNRKDALNFWKCILVKFKSQAVVSVNFGEFKNRDKGRPLGRKLGICHLKNVFLQWYSIMK
jgi:hypothetical protein